MNIQNEIVNLKKQADRERVAGTFYYSTRGFVCVEVTKHRKSYSWRFAINPQYTENIMELPESRVCELLKELI